MRLMRNPEPLTEADAAVLRAAIAPLLADLASTGMDLPELRAEAHEDRAGAICGFLRDPGETGETGGTGVYVMRDASPAEQVAGLAEQVQEWATDVQVDPRRPWEWPKCLEHRRAHGLHAEVRDGAAVWVCEEGDHTVAPVGALAR
jgi:hypothetical protein